MPTKKGRAAGPVHLLDGNVLVALVNHAHVHHAAAQRWFAASLCPFATCPITQGTLLRVLLRVVEVAPETAVEVLARLASHARHRFWPDAIGYEDISWRGVHGHRQVIDAYLAGLARHHKGRLVSFDRGLVALHADVAVGLDQG